MANKARSKASKRSSRSARKLEAIVDKLVALGGDPVRSAASAGLWYVADLSVAIGRARSGKGFRYFGADGKTLSDRDEIRRIRALAIPPAWTAVQICPRHDGHIQATGRDARGRKQYRYHPRWREVRDETKYGRMIAFAQALPGIRARVAQDLKRTGLPREKILGAVTLLLERTLIRVGNEEYAKKNDSFGLTTLREEHVDVLGASIRFHFRGKSGKEHVIDVKDRRLAAIIRKCQELPGQELFHYVDEAGQSHILESTHVNAYLREAAGADFSAKDFRTWYGTLLAARALGDIAAGGPPTQKNVAAAIAAVAARLGNTPAVCRRAYVHPAVIARYLRGGLERFAAEDAPPSPSHELSAPEERLLSLLKEELANEGSLDAALAASLRKARAARRGPARAARGTGRRAA